MMAQQAAQEIVRVVGPYIGETMARSATEAHCQKLGIGAGTVSPEQLEALLAKLAGGLNIFLGREKSAVVIADVRRALANLEPGR
jgi:hypothetical protein